MTMITALSDLRLAFIGGGVMGTAIATGLLKQGMVEPNQIVVAEPMVTRRDAVAAQLGVVTTGDNAEAVSGADVVLFAVKPQVLGTVLAGLRGLVPPGTLVLSIVAGATIATYREALGVPCIVRVMPNTPAQVGQGATVWTATPEVTEAQRAEARAILGALGLEVYVDNERYLDAATALSGSGPAYVFLFIEALTDVGVEMGFTRDVAYKLALQTVKGSAIYAEQSGLHPAILRNQVTSPGGTTAAALAEFERGAFRSVVASAVRAAERRSQELGAK